MSKKTLLLWITLTILTTNVIGTRHKFISIRNKNDLSLQQVNQSIYNEKLFDRDIADILDEKFVDSHLTVESTKDEIQNYLKNKIKKINSGLEIILINFQQLNEGSNLLEIKVTIAEFNKTIKINLDNIKLSISNRLKKLQKFILENDLDGNALTTANSYRDALDLITKKIINIDSEAIPIVAEIETKLDEGDNFIDLTIKINQETIIVPMKVVNVKLSSFERLKNSYEIFNGKVYENIFNFTVSTAPQTVLDVVIAEIKDFDSLIKIEPLMINPELKAGDNTFYLKLSIDEIERIVQVVFKNIELSPKKQLEDLTKIILEKNFDGSSLTTDNTVLDMINLLKQELAKINPELKLVDNINKDQNHKLTFDKNVIEVVVKLKDESCNLKATFDKVKKSNYDNAKQILKELQQKVTETVFLNIGNTQHDAINKITELLKTINPAAKLKLVKNFDNNKNLIEGKNEILCEIEVNNITIPANILISNVKSLNFSILEDFKKVLKEEQQLFKGLNTLNTKSHAFDKIVNFAKEFNKDIKLTLTSKKKSECLSELDNMLTFKIKVNNLEEEIDFEIGKIRLSQYHLNLKLFNLVREIDGSSLTTNNYIADVLPLINDKIGLLAKEYDFTIRLYYEEISNKNKLSPNNNVVIVEKINHNNETPKKITASLIIKNVKKVSKS